MPTKVEGPKSLLSVAISRSPCETLISTCVWLSAAVENTWLFFGGIVVLRVMRSSEDTTQSLNTK